MSEDEEKVRKAMSVMAKPDQPVKVLSPIETIERTIHRCEQDGYKVTALSFGQMAFICFARDVEKARGKPKLKLVDASGDDIGNDYLNDVKMWKGMKIYKKSTPGFEPLFQ